MVTRADLPGMLAGLPGARDESNKDRTIFTVSGVKFAWTWLRRYHPRKPRRPDPDVLVIACDLDRKALLVEADPALFFDDDHYAGFPAIMVRLPVVDAGHMAELLSQACAFQLGRPRRR